MSARLVILSGWIGALGAGACGSSSASSSSGPPSDAAPEVATEAGGDGAIDTRADDVRGPAETGGETGGDVAASNPCIDRLDAGPHDYTCDGFVFHVEVPEACVSSACGLVVDVHGRTMSAEMEDANTAMRALGRTYGYIVVQPNANPKPPLSSWNPGADDDHVYAFVQDAIAAFRVDRKRVHLTGFSQGGMMTFRLLCKHADLFASVAPAAGTGCSFKPGDMPSREIPVLYMHGTSDALIDFNTQAVPQRDALIAGWSMGAGAVVASDAQFTRTRYTSPSGTPFEFLQHDYAAASSIIKGHCYPGSTDPGKAKGQLFPFGCVPPNAFVWGDEVMKFFVAHPAK